MTKEYPTISLVRKRNKDVPVFAYMGDFNIKTYGLDTILWAFADYKHKYLESGSLWLIGDGKDKAALIELISKLNIEQSVHLMHLPQGKEKMNLLNQIDLFLRPSRSEFFPTAIIEAAAAAVPSIVSAETTISEQVKEYKAGYVMEENNYKHLAKLLLKTLNEIKYNHWSTMRRNSLKMALDKFQWNKILKTHVHLYGTMHS
ncbi:glycosyltransferase [Sediminibacterium sp.]|uniref:glycosyltransferase n=1 Tax=Sediminibacterium sp. TaxID=1917865 RepID=UPI003F71F59E